MHGRRGQGRSGAARRSVRGGWAAVRHTVERGARQAEDSSRGYEVDVKGGTEEEGATLARLEGEAVGFGLGL